MTGLGEALNTGIGEALITGAGEALITGVGEALITGAGKALISALKDLLGSLRIPRFRGSLKGSLRTLLASPYQGHSKPYTEWIRATQNPKRRS